MLNRIKKYIEKHLLLDKDATHIVALSGGADSVCLLRIMLQLQYKVHAVHCNFRLRGKESNRDENFCKELCSKLNVPLHLAHFDTMLYAKQKHISIEMAARDLRYSYFEQLRKAIDAADIIVAHHRDDNVETVLMALLRGTGIKGLQGIQPRNGNIIRPMLEVSRQEILDYLLTLKQDYVTDSSNLVDDVTRNKIRLNIIPMLKEINPAVVENIARTIENVSESAKIVSDAISKSIEECVETKGEYVIIKRESLAEQPSPETVLYEILKKYNFASKQIKNIYDNINVQSGRVWRAEDYTIASDRKVFIIGKNVDNQYGNPISLPEVGNYNLYNNQHNISIEIKKRTHDFAPSRDANCVTIDADKVKFPVTVRKHNQGDKFTPFGMKGAKLVSDYMTDRKKNYFQRSKQLLIEDASGTVIWVIGERVSQKVACNENTINVMTVRYIDKSSTL